MGKKKSCENCSADLSKEHREDVNKCSKCGKTLCNVCILNIIDCVDIRIDQVCCDCLLNTTTK